MSWYLITQSISRAMAVSGSGSSACLGLNTALNARGSVGTVGSTITATGGYVTLSAGKTVPVFGNYSSPTLTELAGNILAPQTLLAMLAAVDPAYYPTAAWYLSPAQAWGMRSETDAQGRPLLNLANGLTADNVRNADYSGASAVGTLFGFPVILDSNIPVLTASTCGGPIFGDLSRAMVFRVVRGDGTRLDVSQPSMASQVGVNGPNADVMRLTERMPTICKSAI